MIRKIAIPVFIVIVVAGGLLFSGLLDRVGGDRVNNPATISPAAGETDADTSTADGIVGGQFSLIDHNGHPVTQDDFSGNYKLVFFGFTHCPDICPAGLNKMAKSYELLNEPAEELTGLFITIDPERDTVDIMKDYVGLYHDDFIGLTGSRAQIDEAINSFKVYASVADEDKADGHYMMNHSAYIYFLGPDNNAIEFFGSDDSAADIADAVRPYLDGSRG